MSEVEEGPATADGGQSQVNNLYPLLMLQNMGRDSWDKGRRNEKYSDIRQTQHARLEFAFSFLILRVKGFSTRQIWNHGEKVYILLHSYSHMISNVLILMVNYKIMQKYVLVLKVKDLREAVLKLAAADRLRSQGFLRSEQNLPKTNKRGE